MRPDSRKTATGESRTEEAEEGKEGEERKTRKAWKVEDALESYVELLKQGIVGIETEVREM